MYDLIRPLLFRLDPETAHAWALGSLAWSSRHPGALRLLRTFAGREDPRLTVHAFGLRFPNPIGLAAGFDKNALALPGWQALGFGFAEVGSVTGLSQPGNPRPRLFRLPADGGLVNRMGFNNDGVREVALRLARLRAEGTVTFPVGVNIGKSRAVPLDEASADYRRSLETVWELADYLVLNVSSPNTPGLRRLQEAERLEQLLALAADLQRHRPPRPLLLKISPDLVPAQIDGVLALCARYPVAGIVAVNTTIDRTGLATDPGEEGGLSGRPLRRRALEVLRYLVAGHAPPIVSVGGIASVDDVVERLSAGATLVQLYTALVYRGPLLLRDLRSGLLRLLEKRGLAHVSEL